MAAAGPLCFLPGQWVLDEQGGRIEKWVRGYGRTYQIQHSYCGETTHIQRPVCDYLNPAAENHLCLTHMEQPWEETAKDHSALPVFLMAEFQKIGE